MLREAFLSSRSFFVFPLCLFCGLADTVWFQTLGEDASPVLDNTRKTVLYDAQQGYYNQSEDPDAIVSPVPVFHHSRGGAVYNVAGQRVSRVRKGLYITGGKKILVQ